LARSGQNGQDSIGSVLARTVFWMDCCSLSFTASVVNASVFSVAVAHDLRIGPFGCACLHYEVSQVG
jgi:hypothetical protein